MTNTTFGRRVSATPAYAAPRPVVSYDRPREQPDDTGDQSDGLLTRLRRMWKSDDEFDLHLRDDYAPGKSIWVAMALWLLAGGVGAHRFYLGHTRIGLAFVIAATVMFVMLLGSVATAIRFGNFTFLVQLFSGPGAALMVLMLVQFLDGIYVLARMAGDR